MFHLNNSTHPHVLQFIQSIRFKVNIQLSLLFNYQTISKLNEHVINTVMYWKLYEYNKVYKRLSVNVHTNESGRIYKVVTLKKVHFSHKTNYY